MTLRQQLESLKARFQASAPPEVLAVMHRATDDLRKSGIAARVIKPGSTAPDFSLPNANGEIVSSGALIAKGPLVLSFFRGKW